MPTLTTLKIRDYAWMAQASYLDLQQVAPGSLATRLQNDTFYPSSLFAAGQATTFTDSATGYSLVNHQSDEASGFSATLFEGNAGGYTVAVRGTDPVNQPIQDLVNADVLGVVLQGKANFQVFDAYRYYKKLSSPAGKVAYSTDEINAMARMWVTASDKVESITLFPFTVQNLVSSWINTMTFESRVQSMAATIAPMLLNDDGLNAIPAGAPVNFTGHSLGGHVAALLAEMVGHFQGAGKVGDLVTYNAPGTNALSYEVANWVGLNTTVQSGIIGAKHLAIYGEGGMNVTAGLGQINGTRQSSFIETGVLIDNHSMVKLSDVFAVKQIFVTLMPTISDTQSDSFLEAASNQFPDSLEKAIDGIRKVLGLSGSTVTEDRESLYANLKALADLFAEPNGALRAFAGRFTLSLPSTSLVTTAKTDFVAFLNLNALSPVSITTIDEAAISALKAANPTLATAWTTDYNARLRGDTTKVFDYSDNWYADRAAMLAAVVRANQQDVADTAGLIVPGATGMRYLDVATNREVNTGLVGDNYSEKRQTLFGGDGNDGADKLTGKGLADRIYGGAGDDQINGKFGWKSTVNALG